jgi:hypothetical protein
VRLPRRVQWHDGMDATAIARALNEWSRDVVAYLEATQPYAHRLTPTPVLFGGYQARPWECVLVDASKGSADVALPRAADVMGAVIAVVNVSASVTPIVVRASAPGDLVRGAATRTIAAAYGAAQFFAHGTGWAVLGQVT